jgi:signal transduction histidine kinase
MEVSESDSAQMQSPLPDELKLSELVPIETLERLRGLFSEVTDVPMVITDGGGTALTAVEQPIRYCGSLVKCPEITLCLRRKRWDIPEPEVEQKLRREHQLGEPVQHRCRGGFHDTAIPILVEGQTIGYAVFARSLSEPPDIDKFRRLAQEAGMPPEVGQDIAEAAVVMPREKIDKVAQFIQVIAQLVASAAYDSLRAEQIIQLQELRDALIHMIVHDLRTPLVNVIGGLQLVVDRDYDQEMTEKFVPIAAAGAADLLEMVNTLLDINKMEQGKLELNLEEVNFDELVQEAAQQVSESIRQYEHELAFDLDSQCPPIQADAAMLARVLVNLLGNAIKFTPQGGHIRLASHCCENALEFSVTDDGYGIPSEDQAHIFDKFGQAKTRQEGHMYSSGLGLTFCKMAVEAHGGQISLTSQVDRGSTFTVVIPVRHPENDDHSNLSTSACGAGDD